MLGSILRVLTAVFWVTAPVCVVTMVAYSFAGRAGAWLLWTIGASLVAVTLSSGLIAWVEFAKNPMADAEAASGRTRCCSTPSSSPRHCSWRSCTCRPSSSRGRAHGALAYQVYELGTSRTSVSSSDNRPRLAFQVAVSARVAQEPEVKVALV